ncbi:uncharacterized protein LOC132259023 [Phlebotomus argentipes]|uniref:uncharacterized protein LOC132259023 n=1 Tax=Phlebotomus argentipes TaxID=94469 RepID=UPI002892F094|nr:uncharacterized protein LOC132259023 [Phlebotomus argentipes]
MKLSAVLLLFLPFAFCEYEGDVVFEGKSVASRDLQQDLQDFADLIPMSDIMSVAFSHILTDPEVRQLYIYSQSSEFKQLYARAIDTTAVHELIALLESYNLPVISTLNDLAFILLLPEYVPRGRAVTAGGVSGLVDAILRLLPREKLIKLYLEKLMFSPDFRKLMANLASPKTAKAALNVVNNQEVRIAFNELQIRGIDVVKIGKQVVAYFLGLQ